MTDININKNNNINICIGVPLYNCEKNLDKVLHNLTVFMNYFHPINTHIVFYYDISSDNTLQIITDFYFKYNLNVHLLMTFETLGEFNSRSKKLAVVRNKLFEYMKTTFSTYDFFAMMDGNAYSCIGEIKLYVLDEVFSQDNIGKWDSVSFSRVKYYDLWALSIDNYIYSVHHTMDPEKRILNIVQNYIDMVIDDYQKNKPNEFIEVFSAFNGFAIYKMNKFIDCQYSDIIDLSLYPIDNLCEQVKITNIQLFPYIRRYDCEHRYFHLESIKKHNSKIRIFPKNLFQKVSDEIGKDLGGRS